MLRRDLWTVFLVAMLLFLSELSFSQCYGSYPFCSAILENYEPPGAFAGTNTPVYISGVGFGTTQGTVTFNGVLAPVVSWSDRQIVVIVPSNATTGPIVVTTPVVTVSTIHPGYYPWVGNSMAFAPNFVIYPLDQLPDPGPELACQDALGTWTVDYGVDGWGGHSTDTFNILSQVRNQNGTWALTGNAVLDEYCGDYSNYSLTGTLGTDGSMTLHITGGSDDWCGAEWTILTHILKPGCHMTSAETWWPMAKPCEVPDTENTAFDSWVPAKTPINGIGLTIGTWQQPLSLSTNSRVNFDGRLVFEQDPSGGTDNCWFQGSAADKADKISGGSWLVDDASTWAFDRVGFQSCAIDYYRWAGRAGCEVSIPQAMFVDCATGPTQFRTNQLWFPVHDSEACSQRQEQGQTAQKQCTPY